MIVITKYMAAAGTLPARVQATVLGRHGRRLHATVPWNGHLHSAQNHRRALGKLLKRLMANGDVKGQHACMQVEALDGTRYWFVKVVPSTPRWVDDIIHYSEETTP